MSLFELLTTDDFTRRPDPQSRQQLERYLNALPVLWPPDQTELNRFIDREFRFRQPRNRPGVGLLLGWTAGNENAQPGGDLLVCEVGVAPPPLRARRVRNLGDDTLESLNRAWSLARQHTRGAWQHLPDRPVTLSIRSLDFLEPARLQGRSFGLPFALLTASHWLKRPIPVDMICSGELSETGKVLAVDGLRAKVQAALNHTYVRPLRLLVADSQDVEPLRDWIEEKKVHVVPVSDVSVALAKAGLNRHSFDDQNPRESWDTIVQHLYDVAFFQRTSYMHWEPFFDCSEWAVEQKHWPSSPTPQQLLQLSLGAEVIIRHCGRTPAVRAPIAWDAIREEVPEIRALILADLMQSSRDTGFPDVVRCAQEVEMTLPNGLQELFCEESIRTPIEFGWLLRFAEHWMFKLFPAQLRTAGAYLRWKGSDSECWPVCVAANLALVSAWKANHGSSRDISYPLAELLRLLSIDPGHDIVQSTLQKIRDDIDVLNPFQCVSLLRLPNQQLSQQKYLTTLSSIPELLERGSRKLMMAEHRRTNNLSESLDLYQRCYRSSGLTPPEEDSPGLLLFRARYGSVSSVQLEPAIEAIKASDAEVVRQAKKRSPSDLLYQADYILRWFAY